VFLLNALQTRFDGKGWTLNPQLRFLMSVMNSGLKRIRGIVRGIFSGTSPSFPWRDVL
jgi:hypothetical protein